MSCMEFVLAHYTWTVIINHPSPLQTTVIHLFSVCLLLLYLGRRRSRTRKEIKKKPGVGILFFCVVKTMSASATHFFVAQNKFESDKMCVYTFDMARSNDQPCPVSGHKQMQPAQQKLVTVMLLVRLLVKDTQTLRVTVSVSGVR